MVYMAKKNLQLSHGPQIILYVRADLPLSLVAMREGAGLPYDFLR